MQVNSYPLTTHCGPKTLVRFAHFADTQRPVWSSPKRTFTGTCQRMLTTKGVADIASRSRQGIHNKGAACHLIWIQLLAVRSFAHAPALAGVAQSSAVRLTTVSGRLNQIAAAARKLIEARHITGASPKCSAKGAVIRGAVMLITLPQLKIDAAVERRCGGYNSDSHGPQIALHESITP